MVQIKRKLRANIASVSPNQLKRKGRISLPQSKSPNKAALLKRKANASPNKKAKWHTLVKDKVLSCVKAVLRLKAQKETPSEILLNEHQPIYMVVQCVRIPKMQTKNFRFLLPHPVIDEESDVCLFVPDLKKGRNVNHEPTVEHYKELLKAKQIKGISEIIPLRQLKVEYDQYELRRQLISRFDLFLSDGRISGHIHHLLGKEAYRKRRLPVPVDMEAKNLKLEFDRAKSKVLMMMKGTGDKAALKIGHTKQKAEDIVENILEVANSLGRQYPGGWNNVHTLCIHVQDTKSVPVYISLKSRNDVEVPEVKYIVPKKAVPVEGELSTFPGTKVIVLPDGEVIVKKEKKSKEDEEMGSDWDEYDSDMEMIDFNNERNQKVEIKKEKNTPAVKQEPATKDEKDSEEDDEEEEEEEDEVEEKIVEDAESAYLNEWHKERISEMESKAKAEEIKKEHSKKANEKKMPKRKLEEEAAQEVPMKRIKVLKTPQKSNNKALAKQKSKAVTENSESVKTKTKKNKSHIKTPAASVAKKILSKSKKKSNANLEDGKKNKKDIKPKKLSADTEVNARLFNISNDKALKKSKRIINLNEQGNKSKRSNLKEQVSRGKKAADLDKAVLKSKKSALKKTLCKKQVYV